MHCESYSHFFSKKFQHICVVLNVNFNASLTNDIGSFDQLDPEWAQWSQGKQKLSYDDPTANKNYTMMIPKQIKTTL